MHHQYGLFAGRVVIRKIHKTTKTSFKEVVDQLYSLTDKDNNRCQMVSDELYHIVQANHEIIQKEIEFNRDFL